MGISTPYLVLLAVSVWVMMVMEKLMQHGVVQCNSVNALQQECIARIEGVDVRYVFRLWSLLSQKAM